MLDGLCIDMRKKNGIPHVTGVNARSQTSFSFEDEILRGNFLTLF